MDRVTTTYKANGKEYTLTELAHADWQSLLKYLQYRDYHQLKNDANEIPELAEQLPEVLRECSRKKVTMADLENELYAVDIVTELVYLSLRKCHLQLDREEAASLLTPRNQMELLTLIMDISGVKQEAGGSGNPEPGDMAGN